MHTKSVLTLLLLLGCLLGTRAAFSADDPTVAEVRRLVRQLDAPQLADRDAAEAELLRRGPAVLTLLPPVSERMSAEVRQRLGRIRQKLQQSHAEAAADASTITVHADAITLSEALAALQEQSGNPIVDHRQKFSQPAANPTLRLNFVNTPFWQALDQLLDQAGMTVYSFSEGRAVSVVDASDGRKATRVGRACYRGPFRFEAIRADASRDLRAQSGVSLRVVLEVAWEPRLRAIYLVQRMADVQAVDTHGRPIPIANREAQLEVPIGSGAQAVELTIPFQLPPLGAANDAELGDAQDVRQIARLDGKLTAVMPGRIESFRFNKLADATNVTQRIAAVTVTLGQARKVAEGCEVAIRVRFDEAGDALASHRTWIFSNEAVLEDAAGKPLPHASYETTLQKKDEVGITYRFHTDQPIGAMTFVYKTPGAIVAKEIVYELRNIALP